jgi:hypothetical protein
VRPSFRHESAKEPLRAILLDIRSSLFSLDVRSVITDDGAAENAIAPPALRTGLVIVEDSLEERSLAE